MSIQNIILDIDVAIELLMEGTHGYRPTTAILDEAQKKGCPVWLVAATLPTIIRFLQKKLESTTTATTNQRTSSDSQVHSAMQRFMKKVKILSSYSFHADDLLKTNYPEGAFILKAAYELGPADTVILSRTADFVDSESRVITPERLIEKLDLSQTNTKAIPFVDLAQQKQRILPLLEQNICTVLRHGQYIMGPEVKELEAKLSSYVGVNHAISCSSGTDALLMALMAYDVGPGDAIFTSPFTFFASAETISLLGATPVFVDINPETFNIDPNSLQTAVTALKKKEPQIHVLPNIASLPTKDLTPKGIITVDLFGLPAEYNEINSCAQAQGLFVIEDAAQSFGSQYHDKKTCSLTEIGCTSFFPAKPLGCYGDGGAVFTNNHELAKKLASIRIHGEDTDKYTNIHIGINGRMDSLQAAILLPKLDIFPDELIARDQVANHYTERLHSIKSLTLPSVPQGVRSAWAQYSILSDNRDDLQAALKAEGIPTAIYYSKPLHLQTAFTKLGYQRGNFPVSETVAQRILSLPMHPYLKEKQIDRITDIIVKTLS